MPAVNVAMQRSMREGFLELLVASLRPVLTKRDVQGDISDAKTAFSSWDNCMNANICKWPAIALMIVGGLIIFSVVWCIIRCACCGLSCCCSCFQCFKCCGDCCGCCDPPRGKRSKYLDEPYVPPNQGYKAPSPMSPFAPGATMPAHSTMPPPIATTGVMPAPQFSSAPQYSSTPQYSSAPQFAEFDVSKKPEHEDALPAMPSWEGAEKKKIMLEEEGLEMDQLKKPEASSAQNLPGAASVVGGIGAAGLGMAGRGPSPGHSPGNRSPYGPPGAAQGSNGYFPAPVADNDPYAQHGQGYQQDYQQAGGPYGQNQGMGPNQGYGLAVAGGPMGQGRQSPRVGGYNNGGYAPPARQGSYDTYGNMPPQQASPYDDYNSQPAGGQGYGMGPGPRRTPRDMQMGGGGGHGGYGPDPDYGGGYDNRPLPSREYSTESTRPLRAPPRRQYSHDVEPVLPAIPTQDTGIGGGFDFGTSNYNRPAPNNSYRQPEQAMPEPQQQGGGVYPGYKAYQPGGGQGNNNGQNNGQNNWGGL